MRIGEQIRCYRHWIAALMLGFSLADPHLPFAASIGLMGLAVLIAVASFQLVHAERLGGQTKIVYSPLDTILLAIIWVLFALDVYSRHFSEVRQELINPIYLVVALSLPKFRRAKISPSSV